MKLRFTKMHGAGNDFILIDNREGIFSGMEHDRIRWLCDRHTGIGADGLMLIEWSTRADFHLQYFNADGYPADICGNGARCAVVFAWQQGMVANPQQVRFTTPTQYYQAMVMNPHRAAVQFPAPKPFKEKPDLAREFHAQHLWFGNTGVPHVVMLASELPNSHLVVELGRRLRNHPAFQPEGTNVNFVVVREPGWLKARVYERGVEAETLACGTGALACATVAHQFLNMEPPIRVEYPGGILEVRWNPEENALWLEGPVATVFDGQMELPNETEGDWA